MALEVMGLKVEVSAQQPRELFGAVACLLDKRDWLAVDSAP
jgi:hypothetical protein